jgi:hypothetical protein
VVGLADLEQDLAFRQPLRMKLRSRASTASTPAAETARVANSNGFTNGIGGSSALRVR